MHAQPNQWHIGGQMKNLLIKTKPCAILLLLKDSQQEWYPSKLARASGTSYIHTVNFLANLRKFGIVSLEKKGRQNWYKLTEKGAYLALTLDDLVKKCELAEAESKAPPKADLHPLPAEAPPAHEKASEKKETPEK